MNLPGSKYNHGTLRGNHDAHYLLVYIIYRAIP